MKKTLDWNPAVVCVNNKPPGEFRGQRNLIIALLRMVVKDYLCIPKNKTQRRDFNKAEEYIFAHNPGHPLSFQNLCAYLEIQPKRAREALKNQLANIREGVRR